MPSPSFSKADVEINDCVTVYRGYFCVQKYALKHRLFSGGWNNGFHREVLHRGNATGVLLFDPHLNKVVLVEQFRIGAWREMESPWLLEVIAGLQDANENALVAAHRETLEEAGLQLLDVIPICQYLPTPGSSNEKVTLFCGRVDASKAGGIHGLPEENEDILVHVLDLETVYTMLAQNQISNAPTLIALQWLQINESKVRQQWLVK